MEKLQINQVVLRPAASDSRKNHLFTVSLICLLLGIGVVVSMALLGGTLGRFSGVETNVIALVSPKTGTESGGGSPIQSGSAGDGAASPRNAGGTTGRSTQYQGNLTVFDDQKTWSTETQVDLFRASYDGTVASGDGEKVIAPGTSNFYGFSLKNNGNIPLDYTVSLRVEALTQEQAAPSPIPLEWRLLNGSGNAVSNWKEYGPQDETLKRANLAVRRQDSYTVEWRWAYEHGADRTDTALGDAAVEQLLGVKATITVFAEQSADWDGKPTGPWWLPQTGDTFNMALYLTVMAISGGGLVLLLVIARRKKKDQDGDGA